MSVPIERDTRSLHVVSSDEQANDHISNITDISPYLPNPPLQETFHQPSAEAFIKVSQVGLAKGEQVLFVDDANHEHKTEVLSSEMYDLRQNSQTGEITGYFHHYTPYGSDEYGIIHPHTVANRRIVKNEFGQVFQDNTERQVAYTGHEAQRVLTVSYDPKTGEITKEYIKSRNLRYALADKVRLEKTREQLRLITEKKGNHNSLPSAVKRAAGIEKVQEPDEEELLFVAD